MLKLQRIDAGHYRYKQYHIWRFKSEYSDIQWMIDEDGGQSSIAQCDTLQSARITLGNILSAKESE